MIEIEEMLEVLTRPRFDWLQLEVAGVCNAACAYCALTCYKGVHEGGLGDQTAGGFDGDRLVIYDARTLKKVKTVSMEVPAGVFSHLRARTVVVGLESTAQ